MRRVVVTGMGILSPLGVGIEKVWERLVQGASGICQIDRFPVDGLRAKIAGFVPHGTDADALDYEGVFSAPERKKNDRFILYAMAASDEAMQGNTPENEEEAELFGVSIGSGIGGLPYIEETALKMKDKGARCISPFFLPACLINLASGQVSIRHKLKGPNYSIVSACATGTHAIGESARLIAEGIADRMLAGGSEAAVCPLGIGGFVAMKALSTNFNERPTEASRPWDKDRDGFIMGEGAGLLVLEEYEHAKKRGAKIYGEIVGYGLSGDAYHVAAPEGLGAERAMKQALARARIAPSEIGYINAHGTSTPPGDSVEIKAVHNVFGAHTRDLSMSSTKSSVGHLLGAAGGVEAIFTLKALETSILPPTLNLHNCTEETDIDLIPLKAKEKKGLTYAMSNSFGFGGTNASVIFKTVRT